MRYAWTWRIKPDQIDEYVRMCRDPWPEIMKEHAAAGIHDYSIYREGDRFFYTFACDDVEAAFRYLAASEPFQRWNAITSNMKEGSFDCLVGDFIFFVIKRSCLKSFTTHKRSPPPINLTKEN